MNTSIHAIDAAILVAYLIMLTGVGLYFSRRQVNLDEFFRARRVRVTKSTFGVQVPGADPPYRLFLSDADVAQPTHFCRNS
jgi:hypothetical protein